MGLYDRQQHRSHAFLYGHDPAVVCLSMVAMALWHLGYPDQALQRVHEALTLARELDHPFSLAWALAYVALLHQYRREGPLAQQWAEAAISICEEQGFALWLAAGTYVRGWALAEQGQGEEGVAQIRHGISVYRGTGAELAICSQLGFLAEAYEKVGQTEEGLSVLTEALTLVNRTGERHYEAELYRLKGEYYSGPKSKVPSRKSEKPKRFSRKPSRLRGASRPSHWNCGRRKPGSAMATTRQERRGPPDVIRDLRLVHRRV